MISALATSGDYAYRQVERAGLSPSAVLCVRYGNPVSNQVNTNEYINDVVGNMDLYVVADYTFTDTVKYADIVLPAAHWFEQQELDCPFPPLSASSTVTRRPSTLCTSRRATSTSLQAFGCWHGASGSQCDLSERRATCPRWSTRRGLWRPWHHLRSPSKKTRTCIGMRTTARRFALARTPNSAPNRARLEFYVENPTRAVRLGPGI